MTTFDRDLDPAVDGDHPAVGKTIRDRFPEAVRAAGGLALAEAVGSANRCCLRAMPGADVPVDSLSLLGARSGASLDDATLETMTEPLAPMRQRTGAHAVLVWVCSCGLHRVTASRRRVP